MPARIAIPLPTSSDEAYNRLNWPAYAEAVRAAGGEPVPVPLGLSDIDLKALWETVQGLLLPGSPADVDPTLYGHGRDEASAPADPARERIDRFLLEQASLTQKPVLAICFGMQMLNVVEGGTLIQDLTVLPVNHSSGRSVHVAHTATVSPDSLLAASVDSTEVVPAGTGLAGTAPAGTGRRLPINSSHHQSVGVLGQGLTVVARCPQDGVVEAIERAPSASGAAPQPFLIGVQWHPERTVATSATSRALFSRLVAEAWIHVRPA